jgi:hypothetical protein
VAFIRPGVDRDPTGWAPCTCQVEVDARRLGFGRFAQRFERRGGTRLERAGGWDRRPWRRRSHRARAPALIFADKRGIRRVHHLAGSGVGRAVRVAGACGAID